MNVKSPETERGNIYCAFQDPMSLFGFMQEEVAINPRAVNWDAISVRALEMEAEGGEKAEMVGRYARMFGAEVKRQRHIFEARTILHYGSAAVDGALAFQDMQINREREAHLERVSLATQSIGTDS